MVSVTQLFQSRWARRATGLALVFCVGLLEPGCGRSGGRSGGAGDHTLKPVVMFGGVGTSPGQFAYPRAIDSDGRDLWIIDKMARVQRIDPETGRCLEIWRMPEWKNGKPTGVTVFRGEPPLLFVPDTHYQRVMVYAIEPREAVIARGGGRAVEKATPEPVAMFGKRGKGLGEFIYPTDVAIVPTSDGKRPLKVFIAEYGDNDRISIWEPDAAGVYQPKGSFGVWGPGEDPKAIEFNRPQAVVFDAKRSELLIADSSNHRIGRFTLDGGLVKWIGSRETAGVERGGEGMRDGPEVEGFNYPYSVEPLGDGTALVVEMGGARVRQIDLESGATVHLWGARGSGPGQLASPWGLGIAGGQVYILDSGNNRVVGMELPRLRVGLAKGGGV